MPLWRGSMLTSQVQHFCSLEERKRLVKEGGAHPSDTLPRKKTTVTPQLLNKSQQPPVQSSSCVSILPRAMSVSSNTDTHRLHKGQATRSNMYLDSGNGQTYDTMSMDSLDSMDTSISVCSPDNVSW
ncbi:pleckstrin homology-like domain family B member 2 [Oncorhynchus keta]|uniref:pleckstrin homology-like domain family B member 2 n=1 Tax=Oncorhynchus keta TaxID=8018 RepID=UPI00227B7412|nr:pleckstrin homology-like domain family B member 2 [Oncorhynchus keta]